MYYPMETLCRPTATTSPCLYKQVSLALDRRSICAQVKRGEAYGVHAQAHATLVWSSLASGLSTWVS